jgi:hypothetical protein
MAVILRLDRRIQRHLPPVAVNWLDARLRGHDAGGRKVSAVSNDG